jgi:pimeloyl-ACP methyl ester carboxylesterase
MAILIDTFSHAASVWNGLFGNNSSLTMDSLSGNSSYGLSNVGLTSSGFTHSASGKAVCVSGILKVPVVAETVKVLYPGPSNNYELTEFITNFLRVGTDTISTSIGDSTTVSETFEIYSKLCVPANQRSTKDLKSVQFLTHGGTTDSSYWDFAPDYSYVDAAAEKGYATFSYDRLGSGRSEHPDPKQILQAPLQVELAHALVQKLREDSVGGLSFNKVVGVAHSLGSAITQSMSAIHPDDFDAVVLTGHSGFSAGAGTGFAAAAQQIANSLPDRPEFKHLPNGYFSLGPVPQTLQFAFFYYPHFDPQSKWAQGFAQISLLTTHAVFLKEFQTRQTNALGEILTLGRLYVPAPAFRKPVQVLNGKQDYFYCQEDCRAMGGDITTEALTMFYPNRLAERSESVTMPNMGHNVNLHHGRLDAFEKILNFISRIGIKP